MSQTQLVHYVFTVLAPGNRARVERNGKLVQYLDLRKATLMFDRVSAYTDALWVRECGTTVHIRKGEAMHGGAR